ncbi:hypothetical protein DE146DRAFT_2500 [Phaeosphaeria sp. MPI-PUGE-AT-0046c]|nr:hypothetical protein DE146DRAFT_2500 [Phaeosphaeria sp. MPI-PUGE-AT-0046c]
MPAFGFSVGDFIAAIELCNKISKALKDTNGASSDFNNVAIELRGLENVLRRVVALEPNASNIEHVNAIRSLALSCQIPVQSFLRKLQAYESALGPVPTRKFQASRKLKWAFQMVEEVNKMRALIAARTDSINVRLATHSSESLSRIEVQYSQHHNDVLVELGSHQQNLHDISDKLDTTKDELAGEISSASKSLQQGIEDAARQSSDTNLSVVSLTTAFTSSQASLMSLKDVCLEMLLILRKLPTDLLTMLRNIQESNVQMYALLLKIASSVPASPSWLLTSNIRFEDALGVKLDLPYEFFKHWEIFESMLSCKFKDRPGMRHVRSGRYLILNSRIPGETISKDDWDLIVQPGVQLHMSIGLVRSYTKSANCPRPDCIGKIVPIEGRSQNESSTVLCKQCGVQSMYIPESSEPFATNSLLPRPAGTGLAKYDQHHPNDQDSAGERTDKQNRLLVQQNIAILAAATKGIVCFLRLVARLRKREEREFKAFKSVHMKLLSIRSAPSKSTSSVDQHFNLSDFSSPDSDTDSEISDNQTSQHPLQIPQSRARRHFALRLAQRKAQLASAQKYDDDSDTDSEISDNQASQHLLQMLPSRTRRKFALRLAHRKAQLVAAHKQEDDLENKDTETTHEQEAGEGH